MMDVWEVDSKNMRPNDENNYHLLVLQKVLYPNFSQLTMYPVYIKNSSILANLDWQQFEEYVEKHPNIHFVIHNSAFGHKFNPRPNISYFKKPARQSFTFIQKYQNLETFDIANKCLFVNGVLSSWNVTRTEGSNRYSLTIPKSPLIVNNQFAITFSSKKRLYFYEACHSHYSLEPSNGLFHRTILPFNSNMSQILNPIGTWKHCAPKIEHFLILRHFGISLCNNQTFLQLFIQDIWNEILLFLLEEFSFHPNKDVRSFSSYTEMFTVVRQNFQN